MKKKLLLLGVMAGLIACIGCNSSDTGTDTEPTTEQSAEGTTAEQPLQDYEVSYLKAVDKLPQLEDPKAGDPVATLHTSMGDIKVRFFPEYAPKAVENFTTLAQNGYYDGVTFHRVINDFMIQSGDPEGTGRGGESMWGEDFEFETTPDLRHFRGALCMANTGQPVSNGSQFYIVQCPDIGDSAKSTLESMRTAKDDVYFDNSQTGTVTNGDIFPDAVIDEYVNNGGVPSLDGHYTVFGQVYEGMDVVDQIAAVETSQDPNIMDKPLEDIIINSIDVGTYE